MRRSKLMAFFDEVVAASGLAPVIAPHVIRRACTRAGVSIADLDRRNLSTVFTTLEAALLVYLPPAEAAVRMAAIRKLAL